MHSLECIPPPTNVLHNIEKKLITKTIGIIVLTPSEQSRVAVVLFHILQTGEEKIIFVDLDQNGDQSNHPKF